MPFTFYNIDQHFDTILEILTPETTLHAAKKLETLYNQFCHSVQSLFVIISENMNILAT